MDPLRLKRDRDAFPSGGLDRAPIEIAAPALREGATLVSYDAHFAAIRAVGLVLLAE